MFDDIRNDVDKLVKFKQISMELLFSFSFGEIEAKLHRVFTNKIWLLYVFDREGLCAIKIWLPVSKREKEINGPISKECRSFVSRKVVIFACRRSWFPSRCDKIRSGRKKKCWPYRNIRGNTRNPFIVISTLCIPANSVTSYIRFNIRFNALRAARENNPSLLASTHFLRTVW